MSLPAQASDLVNLETMVAPTGAAILRRFVIGREGHRAVLFNPLLTTIYHNKPTLHPATGIIARIIASFDLLERTIANRCICYTSVQGPTITATRCLECCGSLLSCL